MSCAAAQCQLLDASALLAEVDQAIRALETGAQIPGKERKIRCRFCGVGMYSLVSDLEKGDFGNPRDKHHFYSCDSCGHVESFFWRNNQPPPAWDSE